jgi:hypothetical protein
LNGLNPFDSVADILLRLLVNISLDTALLPIKIVGSKTHKLIGIKTRYVNIS